MTVCYFVRCRSVKNKFFQKNSKKMKKNNDFLKKRLTIIFKMSIMQKNFLKIRLRRYAAFVFGRIE